MRQFLAAFITKATTKTCIESSKPPDDLGIPRNLFFPIRGLYIEAKPHQFIEGSIKLAIVEFTTVFLNVSLQSYRRDVKLQRVRHSLQLSYWVQNESSKQMFHLVNAFCFAGSVTGHNAFRILRKLQISS